MKAVEIAKLKTEALITELAVATLAVEVLDKLVKMTTEQEIRKLKADWKRDIGPYKSRLGKIIAELRKQGADLFYEGWVA